MSIPVKVGNIDYYITLIHNIKIYVFDQQFSEYINFSRCKEILMHLGETKVLI